MRKQLDPHCPIFVQIYFGNLVIRWDGENSLALEDLDLLLSSHVTVTWVLGCLIRKWDINVGLA